MAKLRVAVLFGGASKDYSVSLRSAYSVLTALDKDKYEIVPVGITKAGRWLYYPGSYENIADGSWENDSDCCSCILSPDHIQSGIIKFLGDDDCSLQRIDVIFSLLHGKYGECGRIQGLCKLSGIAFVGSSDEAANCCTDKMLTHLILNAASIGTPKYMYLERVKLDTLDDYLERAEKLGYPMYVKPASCSSSIGTSFVSCRDELKAAVKLAFSHHHKVIVEEALNGRELECAVIGSTYSLEASPVGEVRRKNGVLDESQVYIANTAELVIPAELDAEIAEQIKTISKKAFRVLGCKDFAKFNFRLTDYGIFCCKASHIPGFTRCNSFPRLMGAAGYDYEELLDMLINLSVEARS